MASKLGRFDRNVETLKIDAEGNVSNQTSSVRDMLLNTEMHVSKYSNRQRVMIVYTYME